eukprot:TRINITY_DN6328_c0_g1_i2.p1 TRINITY_DN6328_c0_g1~~TRINITY_DN6328_c0_g1_i2.p1  ORF type:complete len:407 (+),score=59.24 TRINITY_DN6328_c0_g1_i2:20-1240(+)
MTNPYYHSQLLNSISRNEPSEQSGLQNPFISSGQVPRYPIAETNYQRMQRRYQEENHLGESGEQGVVLDFNILTSDDCDAFYYFVERCFSSSVVPIGDIKDFYDEKGYLPNEVRAVVWQLFMDYVPSVRVDQNSTLKEKRQMYLDYYKSFYHDCEVNEDLLRQIDNDVIRTHPEGFRDMFENPIIRMSLKRVLYLWSAVNSDVSYFQGLNELCVPFFLVFMTHCFGDVSDKHFKSNVTFKTKFNILLPSVEADLFWALDILLSRLREKHTFTDAGIFAESMVSQLETAMNHVNPTLTKHILDKGLTFFHFSFRWMLCLMTRELSAKNLIELWDYYILEPNGFEINHVYFCAAFLNHLSDSCLKLTQMEDLLLFLQSPKSIRWNSRTLKGIIARAKIIKNHFVNDVN